MLSLILSYHTNLGRRFFAEDRFSRMIVSGISLAFGLFVTWGIYLLFEGGITYIETQDFVGRALLEYMYQSFFLIIAFCVWISTIIFVLFRIAKSDTDAWIIASPRASILPLYWAGLATVVSIPIIIAILPELIAAHSVYGLSLTSWIIGLLAIEAFLMTLIAISLASLALVMKLLQASRLLSLKSLVCVFSLLGILFLAGIAFVTVGQDTTEVFQAEIIDIDQADPARVTRAFAWSPGYLMAQLLLSLHTQQTLQALSWLLVLYSLAAVSFGVYWAIMKTSLLSLWTDLRATNQSNHHTRSRFPSWGDSLAAAIAEKEFLSIIRNKKDLLWVGFVGLLWLLTLSMSNRAPEITLETLIEQDRFIVYGIWGVSMYFTFLIILRFVFTTFVYDQPYQWILLSSPASQYKMYLGKLLSFLLLGFGLIATLISLSSWVIQLPISVYVIILVMGLTGITVGVTTAFALGSTFLKTSRTIISRDQASTSLPGLLFVALSSVWSILIIITLEAGITQDVWLGFLVMIIISILTAFGAHLITSSKIRALHTE